jgi:CheY-like chemotaxis protein
MLSSASVPRSIEEASIPVRDDGDPPGPPVGAAGASVLLVEDDDAFRHSVEEDLQEHGLTPIPVRDGRDALDFLLAAQSLPALILLDLWLPRMDGWAFVRVVRSYRRFAGIPIVALTASHGIPPADVLKTLRKPVRCDDLIAVVRRAIEPAS